MLRERQASPLLASHYFVLICGERGWNWLKPLKRLALRKQSQWSNILCDTIVASARYVYHHTSDSKLKLRRHDISLIVRHLNTFKCNSFIRSEMHTGDEFVLDLFEAMCYYIEVLLSAS